MHTLADVARSLSRPVIYLSGLQKRFALPVMEIYSDAYVAFFRTFTFLRTLGITEETLARLWHLETKLLALLHVDSTGSPTWFLDSCGPVGNRNRRLLLTNYDLGVDIPSRKLQLGLNFGEATPELFAGIEMGEDALRVLEEYRTALTAIQRDITAELPQLAAAAKWGRGFVE